MAGRPGSGGLGGPAAGDQLAVPAQDGGRGDEQPEASAGREQSGEGGDQGAVGPGHPRARRASLEHGELVAQDQDLDLLGGVGSGAQHDPAQELGEHLVDQSQRHQRIMPGCLPRTNGQVRGCVRSFGHPHAQGRWRAVNGPHLVALVRAGARFEAGKLVERPAEHPQPEAA